MKKSLTLSRQFPFKQGNQNAVREHGIFAHHGEHAKLSDLTKSTHAISLLTTKKLGLSCT